MDSIEQLKEEVQGSLEKAFIDNAANMKKEMELLNIFLTGFVDAEYTYDEYCKSMMNFQLEGCDKIDVDFDAKSELTDREKAIIQSRAVRKHMSNPETTIYEEVFQEEYINWLVEKSITLDKKVFYQVFNHCNQMLIKNKVGNDVWSQKRNIFVSVCEAKAQSHANLVAENNKERHEDEIRTSML